MGTLIVVDMQPYFGDSQEPWLVRNVRREIRAARQRGDGIVVLKFDGCGKTDKRILRTIGKYPRAFEKYKYDCDGSGVAIKTMKRHNLDMANIRVVGVATDACVQETVLGLSRQLRKSMITLVADACNHETRTQRNHGRSGIRRKNIRHINTHVKLPDNLYNLR